MGSEQGLVLRGGTQEQNGSTGGRSLAMEEDDVRLGGSRSQGFWKVP